MARTVRNAKLDTRSARANLPQQKAPHWMPITRSFSIGYRKGAKGGVWLAKLVIADFRQEKTIGPADDALDPNGVTVLSYAQAQEKAREWKARIESEQAGGPRSPITVREALDSYEADLKARGGDIENIGRLRAHLSDHLLDKAVADLTWTELRKWRDGLTKAPSGKRKTGPSKAEKLSPATINRTCTVFKAVLNHVAADPGHRINKQVWEHGLASIHNAEQARNVILDDPIVRQIVAEAYSHSPEFGLFVDVAAVTGARTSQIRRLTVADLQADGDVPRLMMAASFKGKTRTPKTSHHPVPITPDLANRLRAGRSCGKAANRAAAGEAGQRQVAWQGMAGCGPRSALRVSR